MSLEPADAPEQPDPGWRDPDHSPAFDSLVELLDYFQSWAGVNAARRLIYRQLRPAPGRRILDVGCGTGVDVAALAPRVTPGGLVTGLDASEKMVALARERYGGLGGVEFGTGRLQWLPFGDAVFDASFALRTLQYLEEPLSALGEMVRVTKPGGSVVVAEGGMAVADLPLPELAGRILGHERWRSRTGFGVTLRRLFLDAGLTRVKVEPATVVETGPSRYFEAQAREAASDAVQRGEVTEEESRLWLTELERAIASGAWFSADCMFVASGRVPALRAGRA